MVQPQYLTNYFQKFFFEKPEPTTAIRQAETLPAIDPAHKKIPSFWIGHIILTKKND